MKFLLSLRATVLLFALLLSGLRANELNLPVKSYILLDHQSGRVLNELNADQRLPPASITKLMTAYLVFEALASNKIKLTDTVVVSQEAYKQEGSRMFIELNKSVAIEDLLRGLIIQSGNDASIALAETVGGTVGEFVKMMNAKAQALGMTNTSFSNPNGLPDPNHYSTARDIAILARNMIANYPQYYHYYSEKSFKYNKIDQKNRNRLLFTNPQVDGLKTGHTQEAGYCLASSEKRTNGRMIAVVLGAEKENQRYEASQALLNYGFAQFETVTVLSANKILQTVPVYKGEINEVNGVVAQDVQLTVFKMDKPHLSASIHLDTAIAPIQKGQKLGRVDIILNNQVIKTVDVVANEAIPEAGFFKRLWHSMKLWFN